MSVRVYNEDEALNPRLAFDTGFDGDEIITRLVLISLDVNACECDITLMLQPVEVCDGIISIKLTFDDLSV